MRKLQILFALGLWLASPAIFAAAPMEPGNGPGENRERGLESGTEVNQPASTENLGFHHLITGRVTKIDRRSDMVGLETAAGDLQLYFQPNDVRDLIVGETITANLGLWLGSPHVPPLRAGDAPVAPKIPRNDSTVTGTVDSIDHVAGILGVSTKRGPLRLAFEPDQIKALRIGDRITLEMAYNKPK